MVVPPLFNPGRCTDQAVVFEDISVEGRVKTSDRHFMRRQNLHTDYKLELRESFLPKITESVEKAFLKLSDNDLTANVTASFGPVAPNRPLRKARRVFWRSPKRF